mgnify:CR=1 FL=1
METIPPIEATITQIEVAWELKRAGHSAQEIADQLGKDRATNYRWLKGLRMRGLRGYQATFRQAKHGASNVRVFGSVARGEATPESDVDLLVTFPAQVGLYELVGLSQELEALLGRSVSVVPAPITGDERFKLAVLADAVPL